MDTAALKRLAILPQEWEPLGEQDKTAEAEALDEILRHAGLLERRAEIIVWRDDDNRKLRLVVELCGLAYEGEYHRLLNPYLPSEWQDRKGNIVATTALAHRRSVEGNRLLSEGGALPLVPMRVRAMERTIIIDKPATWSDGMDRPPERRTRPLGMAEAAKLMGYRGTDKTKVKRLRRVMDEGTMPHIPLGRQSYIFDRAEFPKDAQDKLG